MHFIPSLTPLEMGAQAVLVACIIAWAWSGPETVAQFSTPLNWMHTLHSTVVSLRVT